eukprot:6435349-Prorocentrum_lima.AAC.1
MDATAFQWNITQVLFYFRKSLKGNALDWFTNISDEKISKIQTITDLKDTFFSKFGLKEPHVERAEASLDNLQQREEETIQEYADRYTSLCRQANSSIEDERLMKKFRRGLSDKITKSILTQKQYTSFDELVGAAELIAQNSGTTEKAEKVRKITTIERRDEEMMDSEGNRITDRQEEGLAPLPEGQTSALINAVLQQTAAQTVAQTAAD